jgi:tRNA(Arg) A34 adenosine deaminase TadA
MCAGTQYWANIGKLVFGITERQLLAFTGSHDENPTMDVPCRFIFEHSQKAIQVWGPIEEVTAEICELHQTFWE